MKSLKMARKKQTGVALVAVLMIIAIVVVIAVNMSSRLHLQLKRQENMQQQQQAFWYAMGAEQFAKVLLARELTDATSVNLSQNWAMSGATFPVEDGHIAGSIKDLRSCFNLNALQVSGSMPGNLAAKVNVNAAQQAFTRLLELKASELSMSADNLTSRIIDWLDSDSLLVNAGSAEDDDYASLEFPYYAANSLMASKSELRVILGVTPSDYQLLLPYICVLPQDNSLRINVNTLTEDNAVLLAAIIPQLSLQTALDIIANRPEQGFTTIADFFALPELSALDIPENSKALLSVSSDIFELTAVAGYLESGFTLTSVLKKNDNQIKVLSRRFGGLG